MFKKRQDKTTLLPQALLERIKEQESPNATGLKRKGRSRREKRDAEKNAKKKRKVEYFANKKGTKRPLESAEDLEPPMKRLKVGDKPLNRPRSISTMQNISKVDTVPIKQVVKKSPEKKSSKNGKEKTPTILQRRPQIELDEDKEIAWLEYQLGLAGPKAKKSKSYKKVLQEDGLDDLLDGLEDTLMDLGGSPDEENDASVSDEEDESDESSEDEDTYVAEEEKMASEASEDQDSDEDPEEQVSGAPSEDPTTSKYIPPHLRKPADQDDQKNARLLRQLKGQMNRLSEQNISTVLSELEELYRQNPRNDVTTTLTSVIIDSIASNASLLDNHIALSAALVASLYRIVGIEFAAYFVQEVVKAYEKAYATAGKQSSISDTEIIGKESLNLLVCIAELYNMEVVSCVLIYDIVRALLREGMGELEVELLLKVLRISGRQLRQDDPLALKDIVQLVSENTTHRKDELSSRTRFMIETLTNLKNNRVKKSENEGLDTVDRMKKFIAGLSKKYHAGREPLRVTLDDLHSADSKGKWWLVGAAWAGDPLMDNKRARHDEQPKPQRDDTATESQRLLELAKKQGMNTDVRRSIFIVLMNSDDYFDASERLGQLNLTEQQQREIIRVLLHCCGNEKGYNPYYALVGQRLCEQAHSYKITAQFCLWDFLRELGEGDVGGTEMLKSRSSEVGFSERGVSKERARNVARLYAWWIAKGSVSLAILKPLDFVKLKSSTREFLDLLLLDTFTNSQISAPILSMTGRHTLWNQSKRSKRPIEEILLKAVRHETLARGLIIYFAGMERKLLPRMEESERDFFQWCLENGKEILETGLSLVPLVD